MEDLYLRDQGGDDDSTEVEEGCGLMGKFGSTDSEVVGVREAKVQDWETKRILEVFVPAPFANYNSIPSSRFQCRDLTVNW